MDTKDLDGETNLKEKMVSSDFSELTFQDIVNMTGHVQCDMPNEYMDSWEGTLFSKSLKFFTNSNNKNFLLKGSILKNTSEIIGLVIYTGFNTKIMKNAKHPRIKMSNVMKTMNLILITVFLFQLICCNIFSYAYLELTEENDKYLKNYIKSEYTVSLFAFTIKFFTFLVAFSHLIPISLYVAMELVKMFQSWFILYDNLMFDINANKPALARTSELIEELGQVEFIFSDKTGTLTINKMEFKNCYIGGVIFGSKDNSNELKNKNFINNNFSDKRNLENSEEEKGNSIVTKTKSSRNKSITFDNIISNHMKELGKTLKLDSPLNFCGDFRLPKILAFPLEKYLKEIEETFNIKTTNNNSVFIDDSNNLVLNNFEIEPTINISPIDMKKKILNFFRVCTICHSAICEEDENGNIKYSSSSPEEIAFLNGSKDFGITVKKRTPNSIVIFNSYTKENEIWEILLEIPFESDRRRMTIVVKKKDDIDDVVYVLTKGADETLIPLINLDDLGRISLEGN